MHSKMNFNLIRILIILIVIVGLPHFDISIRPALASINLRSATCLGTERRALLEFKQGLTDPSRRLSSWVGSTDCCQWVGISCDYMSGHVLQVDLRNPFPSTSYGIASLASGDTTAYEASCLGGEVNTSLVELKYLGYLDLSLNDFQGIPIPESFGMLKNLTYLNLSSSSFGGDIPTQLKYLSKLEYLDLYSNELTADNLDWISGLSYLKFVNLGQNQLDNVGLGWMEAINKLPSLVELHLPSCSLQSILVSLPFVNFTNLSVVDLSGNSFNSSIPNWLLNLKNLTHLDLNSNSFSNSIPEYFANLTSLEYLDLSSNNFSQGPVPGFFGKHCRLESLKLSGCNFVGDVNDFFDGFSACPSNGLTSLDLSFNQLNSTLPESIGLLKKLVNLNLGGNAFWGSIPQSIGNLTSLQQLDLSMNEMNGTIPESFGQLSELAVLYLQGNPWEGVITEAQFSNLTRLQNVIVRPSTPNSLIFNMTDGWVPPFRLITADLFNCQLGPRFPTWLRVQNELTYVVLKNTEIEDVIPEEWYTEIAGQLTSLDLSNNLIRGRLPSVLSSPLLTTIDLSYNQIEGPLPLWSTNATHVSLQENSFSGFIPSNINELMPQVSYLYLSENNLSGTIPSCFCTMISLEVLSLRDNHLSGLLPSCWNETQTLWVLDLANNNISGKIPSSIGLLSSLSLLMLSNNNLVGEIPASLQNCSLLSIDLGGNNLSGKLPLWIGETDADFWMIQLRSNSFEGTIPEKWCNLQTLHILDLSQNNLTGVIPTCLGNLSSLIYGNSTISYYNFFRGHQYMYFEQTVLMTKGQQLEYSSTLEYVNIIDLSGNNLVGGIPEGITNLTALGTLNLSMNHLTGSIPTDTGSIRFLETLDLSRNNLSGHIPQSVSDLTSLSHFNLSYNKLEGRIPMGNQLQTINDSSIYEGNPLLCGIPLANRCPGDPQVSNNPKLASYRGGEDNTDGQVFESEWFSIGIGSGFVLGFLGFSYTIWWHKKSWTDAYFRFLRIM